MKRLPMTVYIGLFVAAMATPSFAADLPRPSYKAPVYVAPIYSWTGFYIGLNGGYMRGSNQWTASGGSFETSPNGWMGGGTLGYNWQTGVWVLGVEGDIDYASLKGTADSAFCAGCTFKDTWLGTARARLGYAYDRWLPYLTGGLAYGNMYISGPSGSATKTQAGWTVGGGVEYALAGNWTTKLEYLYVDLGTATCGMATCGLATDASADMKAHLIRLGVNYRF